MNKNNNKPYAILRLYRAKIVKSTIVCCKNLAHLTHLIKLRFLCLVCQMPNIIAFNTNTTSAVDAFSE